MNSCRGRGKNRGLWWFEFKRDGGATRGCGGLFVWDGAGFGVGVGQTVEGTTRVQPDHMTPKQAFPFFVIVRSFV